MITRPAFPDLYGERAIIDKRKETRMPKGIGYGKKTPPSLKKTAPKTKRKT